MSEQRDAWFESSDLHTMFPTTVWKLQLRAEARERVQAAVLGALSQLRSGLPELGRGEAWQSDHGLHRREDFAELVGLVRHALQGVFRFLKIGAEEAPITGCWANLLAPGAAHCAHSHPNNYLSGVYYVQVGVGADTINFHDPRAQTGILRPPISELTRENTDQVVVRVSNGALLLFPAWLEHSVDANTGADPRVSVSFNVMFAAFVEELAKPLWGDA